jgi:hypothetical protein
MQRMILRRIDPEAESFDIVLAALKASPEISILEENHPTSFLIQGNATSISLSGWKVFPIVKYQVPDTKTRIEQN